MIPSVRSSCPRSFKTTGDRIFSVSFSLWIHPSEALLVNFCTFGALPQQGGVTVSMRLTYRMAACCKGHGLFIIHGHAFEGRPYVLG